jgi:hypothetical protein
MYCPVQRMPRPDIPRHITAGDAAIALSLPEFR